MPSVDAHHFFERMTEKEIESDYKRFTSLDPPVKEGYKQLRPLSELDVNCQIPYSQRTEVHLNKTNKGENSMPYDYKALSNKLIENHYQKLITGEVIFDYLGTDLDKRSNANLNNIKARFTKILNEKGYVLVVEPKKGQWLLKIGEEKPGSVKDETDTKKPKSVTKSMKTVNEVAKIVAKEPEIVNEQPKDVTPEPKLTAPEPTLNVVINNYHQPSPNNVDWEVFRKLKEKISKDPMTLIETNDFFEDKGLDCKLVITGLELQEVLRVEQCEPGTCSCEDKEGRGPDPIHEVAPIFSSSPAPVEIPRSAGRINPEFEAALPAFKVAAAIIERSVISPLANQVHKPITGVICPECGNVIFKSVSKEDQINCNCGFVFSAEQIRLIQAEYKCESCDAGARLMLQEGLTEIRCRGCKAPIDLQFNYKHQKYMSLNLIKKH